MDYDPYGGARHHWPADVDGDGDQDVTDQTTINGLAGGSGTAITAGTYNVDCDINRDGTITTTDYNLASNLYSALVKGTLSEKTIGNVFGYSGYVHNAEMGGALYTVRFRHYDTTLGRWIQRDPLEYIDGMSMYGYVGGAPLGALDPYGLCREDEGDAGGGDGYLNPDYGITTADEEDDEETAPTPGDGGGDSGGGYAEEGGGSGHAHSGIRRHTADPASTDPCSGFRA